MESRPSRRQRHAGFHISLVPRCRPEGRLSTIPKPKAVFIHKTLFYATLGFKIPSLKREPAYGEKADVQADQEGVALDDFWPRDVLLQ